MKTVIFTFYTHKTRSEQRLVGHFFVVNFSSKIEKGYRLSMLFARIYMSVKSLKTKVCPTLALLVFSDFKKRVLSYLLCVFFNPCVLVLLEAPKQWYVLLQSEITPPLPSYSDLKCPGGL